MNILNAAVRMLSQLGDLLHQIHPSDFSRPSDALGGATIGQHVRHTLEFFIRFEAGVQSGVINYDKRKHDKVMETDKSIAESAVQRMTAFVKQLPLRSPLHLEVGYHPTDETVEVVETNVLRELIYNIEHTIHHMALIRIGVRDVAPYIRLADDFGVAASTRKHIMAKQPAD